MERGAGPHEAAERRSSEISTAIIANRAYSATVGKFNSINTDGVSCRHSMTSPVVANVLERRLEAERPNQRWVSDSTRWKDSHPSPVHRTEHPETTPGAPLAILALYRAALTAILQRP